MSRQVEIQINVASALQYLGTLYRNPADALKEHISNAIDEHKKAEARGGALPVCRIVFALEKKAVTVEYPYGMDRREFEEALRRVADSAKTRSDVQQIGRLGIGLFSFQQVGRKCTFFSKKSAGGETIRVTLKEGWDKAEIDTALRREELTEPGIRIRIGELKSDPTKARGPLSAERLRTRFAEFFAPYLKDGSLEIVIRTASGALRVEPPEISLPSLVEGLQEIVVPGPPGRTVKLDLYFDPSGQGTVAIRHTGVAVVEDLKALSAYGLEESVYARGHVRGSIDADFLKPLPARTGFEENADWMAFLKLLESYAGLIEAQVETLRQAERERALSELQRAAIHLARDILDAEEFRDLELPGGLARSRAPAERERPSRRGKDTGERSKDPGDRREPGGPRFKYAEVDFETGPARHSRFSDGEVQANRLNPDFQREMQGTDAAKLAYAALLIGKETIAYNDRSGGCDDYLERLLTYYFRLKDSLSSRAGVLGKRARKPR